LWNRLGMAGYDYDRTKTAGEQRKKIPESEVASWKEGLAYNKRKGKGPKGIRFGQKIKHQGKDWLVYDFDADAKAPGGITMVLVSPDYKETLRGAKVPDSYLKTAAAGKYPLFSKYEVNVTAKQIEKLVAKHYDVVPGSCVISKRTSPGIGGAYLNFECQGSDGTKRMGSVGTSLQSSGKVVRALAYINVDG